MRHALASHRKAVVLLALVVLALLIGGEDVVARYGATSVEITVWQDTQNTQATSYAQGALHSVRIFDKTVTDLDFVNNLQIQLDNCVPTIVNGTDAASMSLSYAYQFRFATLGVTTQVYSGNSGTSAWGDLTYALSFPRTYEGIPSGEVFITPDILNTIHDQTGMPVYNT